MKHTRNLLILLSLLFFLGLVYYNYIQAQKAIRQTHPSPLSVSLVSYPKKVTVGRLGTFLWQVDSSPDLSTSYTTIYWGFESSPSALTLSDSPQAVRYPYSQSDYASGSFSLPNDFEVRIKFDKPGRVYFRAYTKIKNEHLWSEENYLDVID